MHSRRSQEAMQRPNGAVGCGVKAPHLYEASQGSAQRAAQANAATANAKQYKGHVVLFMVG